MRIAGVKISHFRGIENCEFVLDEADSLVCLIGKGDSTKSTILNAIRWALAPSRSLGVEDQDFYRCDIDKPIVIEAAVRGLPDELISTSRFGLFLTDKPGFEGATDPVGNGRQPCITIRLTVADDLDPVWEVYKGGRAKRIGAGDRSLLGVSAIFGASDSSFTWARGSGLRRLLADEKEISAVAVNALRRLNGMEGSALIDRSLLCLEDDLKELGVLLEADNLSARALVHRSKLGIPLALFDGTTPVELKGTGTRKLVDAAVGMGVTEVGAVLVIDEIETGLEPHRLRGLLRGLRKKAESEGGQVIITTHSPVAITELDEFEVAAVHSADGVTSVRKMATRTCGDELVRRKLKACAEAFLAKSVIVCEGKTELGIVRALEEAGYAHLSLRGVAPVDASGGAEMFKLARLMNSCGYRTCVFMDSDERKYDGDKKALRSEGIQVFDWDEGMSTELQVFNDVPDEVVRNLISLAVDEWDVGRVRDGLERSGLSYDDAMNPKQGLTSEERRCVGVAAQASGGGKPWFKRIDLGEKLGMIVLGVLESISGSRTEATLGGLAQWVEGGMMSRSRIAFIAPAGYGKTQAIVNRVKDAEGKVLVLTHTNAGVTALGNRLRLAGVEPCCCEVSTIASYCEKWVKAYPEAAGFDEFSTFSGSAYYDQLYPAAGQVLSKDWAQHVLSKSYSCVIVDEYQDCTVAQQEALFALSTGLDLVVYGDPMQSIFYWSGNLASMEDSSFSVRSLDARPYRWINVGAEELGNEIARIRDVLLPTLRGESVSLSLSDSVKGVTLVDAEDAKKFGVPRQLSKYGHDCSFVYLTAREAGEVSFCRRHFGFQVNETIECALLTEWAARFEASVGPERALCLLEFSGVCFTGVTSDLKTYMNKLQAGSLDFDRMKKYPELSQLLTDAARGGGYGCDFAVLDWIERSSAGFRKIRGQLFGEMKRALGFAATHGVRLADAVAKTHGDMESYESRYRFKHVASRTVLSKGLEFDIVIVDATTVTDPRDFYVAVSRCRLGLIVIANSRTLHFDGISR